jgi:hypothetical protein
MTELLSETDRGMLMGAMLKGRFLIQCGQCGVHPLPLKNASANAISRGDSVAILGMKKPPLWGGFSICF